MSFKVKGGENLRRACLMCLNTKKASNNILPEEIEGLPLEQQNKLNFDVLVARLDQVKKDVVSKVGMSTDIIRTFLFEKGLFNGKNILSMKLEKPINSIQKTISDKLSSFADRKDPYSLLKIAGELIAADTTEEVAKVLAMPLQEIESKISFNGIQEKGTKFVSYVMDMEELKFFVVKVSLSLLKVVLLQVVFLGATLTSALLHMLPVLAVILILAILTNAKTTANLLKKMGFVIPLLPAVLLSRLISLTKLSYDKISDVLVNLKQKGMEAFNWTKDKAISLFNGRQAILQEAIKLASHNPVFYTMLEQRLSY